MTGILFSAPSLIPTGAEVALEVWASTAGQTHLLIRGSGKVLRAVEAKAGEFLTAVGCAEPFELVRRQQHPGDGQLTN